MWRIFSNYLDDIFLIIIFFKQSLVKSIRPIIFKFRPVQVIFKVISMGKPLYIKWFKGSYEESVSYLNLTIIQSDLYPGAGVSESFLLLTSTYLMMLFGQNFLSCRVASFGEIPPRCWIPRRTFSDWLGSVVAVVTEVIWGGGICDLFTPEYFAWRKRTIRQMLGTFIFVFMAKILISFMNHAQVLSNLAKIRINT